MTRDEMALMASAALGAKNWETLVAHIVERGVAGYRAGLRAKVEVLPDEQHYEWRCINRAGVLNLIDGSE